jgi:hypothetical protein
MAIESFAKKTQLRSHFLGGSHARIIIGSDDGALTPLSHEQNAQMRSKRFLCVIPEDPKQTLAHVTKSSTAQTARLQPVGRKYWQDSHRQHQTAAKVTALMTGIRRFMKAYATLWQKLYARFPEHAFNQGDRVLGSRVATHLDVGDRFSMQTGRLSQVPNRPIQRSTRHPNSHATKLQTSLPCR